MGRVFHYLRPYVWRIAGGLSLKFTGTIMDLLLPWALAHIVDVVIPRKDMGQVLLWGLFMLLFSGAGLVTSVLANRSASRVARDATRRIRHDLFARIAHLSSAQVDRFTIPSLISRMTSDTYNIHQVIGMMQRIGFRAPILLLGGVLITLTLDPVLTLVLVALLPFMGGAVFFISRRGTPLYQNVQRAADQLVRVVRENIAGVRVIKALSKEDYERRHFENANRQMMEREQKAALNMAFLRPTMNMVLNLGLVLVIAAGALRVNAGTSEVGKIMAFLSYFTIILNAMLSITRVLTMYSKASASAARIVEVLDAPPDLEPQPLPPTPGTARIRFEDVSFSYQKKELDLSHISFALEPGETLGIIGPTGAGKSTIVSLLLRLYDADSGRILVDGRDVRSYPLHDLRQKFGVVFQNDALFADSIAENIRLGRQISMEQIRQAAQSAQADFIKGAQGRGFQGDVAIKGANLSGDQKQRLLIARALAGSPEILLLDDSSSALDYKTDAALRRQIRSRYRATCVIVAQRISSIRHAEHILVLEEGRCLGYGTHEELLRDCPLYREIYQIQMGDGSTPAPEGGDQHAAHQ